MSQSLHATASNCNTASKYSWIWVTSYVTGSKLGVIVSSSRIVLGDFPNMCSSFQSIGFLSLSLSINRKFPSSVTSPTMYMGALSLSEIFLRRCVSFSFITNPILSWDSFPAISLSERVGSPTGSLRISISPPDSSTNSDRQLRCPPAPWSWIETTGLCSDSAIALIALHTRFCISGLARCTAFNSMALVNSPVATEETALPPIPIL